MKVPTHKLNGITKQECITEQNSLPLEVQGEGVFLKKEIFTLIGFTKVPLEIPF